MSQTSAPNTAILAEKTLAGTSQLLRLSLSSDHAFDRYNLHPLLAKSIKQAALKVAGSSEQNPRDLLLVYKSKHEAQLVLATNASSH